MKAVTFLSVKGGVGKTTLAVNTAAMLADRVGGSEKVLVVDLDAQASATVYILGHKKQRGFEESNHTVYGLLSGGVEARDCVVNVSEHTDKWSSRLYLVPGDSRVTELERRIVAESAAGGYGWLYIVRRALEKLSGEGFSYVFIDPPATLGVLSEAALAASRYFILPIVPDDFGRTSFRLFASSFFSGVAMKIRTELGTLPLCGGIVFNKVKSNTAMEKIANSIVEEVHKSKLYGKYPIPLYKTRLHEYIAYTKSLEEHVPLWNIKEKKKHENAIKEFEEYFDEFYEYVVRDKAAAGGQV
ncbi:ParA family protein [Thermofilum pendens]|uniref:Partition protein, ParA-like protein n=1 Tax=Thermofilum pendens (strain DSM 2475 / Hrk 5) TaxID=368408 RepID=A1RYV7_THEPD|nr:ParA family protein [Thermofilum pendens]ABL78387.1 partition protein, ParA-like protein [Thermofilum pendens Hrk 5]